ncbi:hypothetical protein ACFLY6_00880 [Candidatus Dependentiae bacterium]
MVVFVLILFVFTSSLCGGNVGCCSYSNIESRINNNEKNPLRRNLSIAKGCLYVIKNKNLHLRVPYGNTTSTNTLLNLLSPFSWGCARICGHLFLFIRPSKSKLFLKISPTGGIEIIEKNYQTKAEFLVTETTMNMFDKLVYSNQNNVAQMNAWSQSRKCSRLLRNALNSMIYGQFKLLVNRDIFVELLPNEFAFGMSGADELFFKSKIAPENKEESEMIVSASISPLKTTFRLWLGGISVDRSKNTLSEPLDVELSEKEMAELTNIVHKYQSSFSTISSLSEQCIVQQQKLIDSFSDKMELAKQKQKELSKSGFWLDVIQ